MSAVAETAVILLGANGLAATGALVYAVRRVSPWPKPPAAAQPRALGSSQNRASADIPAPNEKVPAVNGSDPVREHHVTAAPEVSYEEFLAAKRRKPPSSGLDCAAEDVCGDLFDHQRHIAAWSVRRGRAAVWADTGLGKTRIQVEWLRQVTGRMGCRGLILAPLAVAQQTIREAAAIGVPVEYVRDAGEAQASPGAVVITNYDRLHLIDPAAFGAVVLDESSILKAFSGTIKRALVEAFRETPFRLCCTATPAPNDLEELCNHADFLGVMSPAEMRSTFFIADSRGEFMRYRLKGHAKGAFYDWLASWAVACRTPSDLGFGDDGYLLPPLEIADHYVGDGWAAEGELFTPRLAGVTQRAQVRRETLAGRVDAAVDLIGREPGEQWIAWCGLNSEADAIAAAVPGAVNVQGSDDADAKAARLLDFAEGRIRVLVSKPSLAGFGLNFQSCARMVFCGLGDSYEQYYQAIRRCYRFGQDRPVQVHIVLADAERVIAENVRAKERTAAETTAGLVAAIAAENRKELFAGTSKGDDYEPRLPLTVPGWLEEHIMTGRIMDQAGGDGWVLYNGDSAEVMPGLPDRSVDLAVFSPPFSSTYTYSPSDRDLGNVPNDAVFWEHFGYITAELLRLMRPGRLVAVHVANLPAYENTHGYSGRRDFRGDTIRHFERAGFFYHSEITIDKNPQAQAIRTHSKGLLFVQLARDAAAMWQAWADYLVVFRAPGRNDKPIASELSQDEWIEYARPVWYGIRETDVLGTHEAREDDDERHLCPLQLPVIERAVRLWSGRGETVLSPFAGIGSEGVGALRHGRRFVGVELKPSYFRVAARNLRAAENGSNQDSLFSADLEAS